MKRKTFVRPTDVKQWYSEGCCGTPTKDTTQDCGFCGENVLKCAQIASDNLTDMMYSIEEGVRKDVPPHTNICGGSGFWCKFCGRFWAQNTCGNCTDDHGSCDGKDLEIKDGRVYCVCGFDLMPAYRGDQGWEEES